MTKLISAIVVVLLMISCKEEYTPKPKAYPRMEFPEHVYQTYKSDCPFTFEHHEKSSVHAAGQKAHPCWINVDYTFLNCRLHLSYAAVDGNLNRLLEDSRSLVYKHTIKASAINQKDIVDEANQVYAKIYEIDGDAASSVQFFATDSLNHFLRGALYFNAASNADSLKPAIDYIREDVSKLVGSISWR